MKPKPLLITLAAFATGTAGAVILYPRITMSNDEAQARQDMQQILAAVREYRAENNGKFPGMEDLPADVPRRAPLSYWSGDTAARRKGMGPLYNLVINQDALNRLAHYDEKTPFNPETEPILMITSWKGPTKQVTKEYISSPGKYVTQTRPAHYKLVGFLDGRIEKMWTPTQLQDTIRVLNTWGIGDEN
jgi:hypothetical protein